jgi:sigma-B regulation protein RsbU (phosphoserine phosphatase)
MIQPSAIGARTDLRKVLVVDDQSDIREALRLLLKGAGYAIQMADSPDGAIAAVAAAEHDLIVIDMNYACDTTSGQEGLALLDRLRVLKQDVPIIAMTGWSTIELAVQAMQHGARDFITKPWDAHQVLELFEKHLRADVDRQHARSSRDNEIALARRIQRKLLPPTQFTAAGLEINCAFLPAGEVGGDLYDFFGIDAENVAFLLGDVCGKGMGAALLVATLQATIRSQAELARDPAALLNRVNYLFFQSTRPEHFATLFFGVYNTRARAIRYVNCGHPAAVLLRANGNCEMLESCALVLGAFETSHFEACTVAFEAGDRLVLFSDGLSEAGMDQNDMDHDDDDWAVDKIRMLSGGASSALAGQLAAIATALDQQTDDITVIDIRCSAL